LTLCDICGKEEEDLVVSLVEGTELITCRNCAKYGKILRIIKKPIIGEKKIEKEFEIKPEKEIIDLIVSDYAEKIRKKREELGLKQEDFAKLVTERESIIHKIETGVFKPSIEMAKKFEKKLGIKLIEQYEEKFEPEKRLGKEAITIGDVIKIRKRKNV
jgi:putative transcription factor